MDNGTAGDGSHHDGDCAVMIHCQAAGLPAAVTPPAFPAGFRGGADAAPVVNRLNVSPATDTPPPKLAL